MKIELWCTCNSYVAAILKSGIDPLKLGLVIFIPYKIVIEKYGRPAAFGNVIK